jgi:hypothetical protein
MYTQVLRTKSRYNTRTSSTTVAWSTVSLPSVSMLVDPMPHHRQTS